MDLHRIERPGPIGRYARPRAMDFRLTPGSFYRALIIVLAVWILHGFLPASTGSVRDGGRELAAVHDGSRPACRAHVRRSASSLIFTCADDRVRAGADDVCLRGAARRNARDVAADRGRRQRGIARSRMAAGRAGWSAPGWPGAGRSELAHPGTLMLWAQRTDPARAAGLGAITRTVHAPPRDHRRLHDPAAVLSLSGKAKSLADGVRASAAPASRRGGRTLRRPGHAGRARLGEQHAGGRAVRRTRHRGSPSRWSACRKPRCGRDHRFARARPVPRLRGRHRTGACAGDEGHGCRRADLLRAGLCHPAVRRQGRAARGRARWGPPAFRVGAYGLSRRL